MQICSCGSALSAIGVDYNQLIHGAYVVLGCASALYDTGLALAALCDCGRVMSRVCQGPKKVGGDHW